MQTAQPPSRRARWQRFWLTVAVCAVAGRALLWLIMSGPAVHAGATFTVRPGERVVMDWAKDRANLGMIVRSVERYHATIPGNLACGLMPEVMADPSGVGGKLTIVSQDDAGWLVAWEGEPTMELEDPDSGRLSSCGRIALMRLSDGQLHALVDLLAGAMTPADAAAMR